MGLPKRDPFHHTYGEYLTWAGPQRFELIDGAAYAMAPAPARIHQKFVLELARQIADTLEDAAYEVYVAPFDVRLPKGNEADQEVDTVVQPDIVVVCDPAKLDASGCRGAPDWVIEVLSPSTAGHDHVLKLALYERHGMHEYWLVHPTDRVLTVYRLQQGRYARPLVQELQGETLADIGPTVRIDWTRATRGLD